MKFLDRLIEVELRIEGHVPFTPVEIVARHLDEENESVIDLGCGSGEPAFTLKRRGRRLIGVDAFAPYLEICRNSRNHWGLVQADIRYLPFRPGSVDAVVCMRVLEHLTSEQGERLLDAAESFAGKQVIFSVPVGSYERPHYHDNPFQEHLSAWSPCDFRKRGYKVRGSGMKGFNALRLIIPHYTRFFLDALWVLTSPITYYWPEISAHMVCIKKLNDRNMKRGSESD